RENEEACNNRQMTTTDENTTEYVTEKLRKSLCVQIYNDKILREIVNELGEELIETYSQDLIRTFCTITERSSNIDNELENNNKREKTIEFLAKWLQIIDNDYMVEYDKCLNKNIWLLSYVYTSFEYEKNDLMSLYTACRTLDNLNINNNILSQDFGRVQFREHIFDSMFNCLWSKLIELSDSSNDELLILWMQTYAFVIKYYPSEKVLDGIQLRMIKTKIQFMHLSYLILLNEQIKIPFELIKDLLRDNNLLDNCDYEENNVTTDGCLKLLPKIIEII
ncbi:unnamed protein product, partial [Didymodactylos carnosus]